MKPVAGYIGAVTHHKVGGYQSCWDSFLRNKMFKVAGIVFYKFLCVCPYCNLLIGC